MRLNHSFAGFRAFSGLGLLAIASSLFCQPLFAKPRPPAPWKPSKPAEISSVKGISGEAKFILQQKLTLGSDSDSIEFQDGKQTNDVEFFKTPRCYLHFKKNVEKKEMSPGHVLKVSKIDNVYKKSGSVHVTFWFDQDNSVSDISCITNYDHTLTVAELKSILGDHFLADFTPSVEKSALFNIVPKKKSVVLSEDSSSSQGYSARVILSDS